MRPNTVLPVGANENQPDYEFADGVVYYVFALDEGTVATTQMPTLDGSIETTVEVHRTGSRVEVSVRGATPTGRWQPWSALPRGVEGVVLVEGGAAQADALGTRLVPAEDVHRLVVHL